MSNMIPMGNEKPGPQSFPGRPTASSFVTTPQTTNSFMSSIPLAGADTRNYAVAPPPRFNGPSMPPAQPYFGSKDVPQQFSTPQFPFPSRGPPSAAQPMPPPTFQPSAGQQPFPAPGSYAQTHIPSGPTGVPPPGVNHMPPTGNVPYKQADVMSQSSRLSAPSFLPHQRAYGPPSSLAGPMGITSREQVQHPVGGPPLGSLQSLVDDFSSLSIGTVPGSMDQGLDPKSLPRPLEGDVEPKSFAEMYPLNCHPRFLRFTTNAIPNSKSLLSRWHLPLGAIIHPLAETPDGEEVPVVNFGPTGIIRCRRCRTYVNPYVTFVDAGRKWRCNICDMLNDVPGEYYSTLDANGRRTDVNQRPELIKGSVEFVAPTEYMVRPPMPPLYFFLIDVSLTAVRSGMLEIVAKTIKCCLDELPGFPRTQIGFLTYDSTLHFYNMKSSLTQPQMMVVSDLDDVFVPLPDDLLVNLSESRSTVDAFLDSLPSMFQDNINVESAFGPALKASVLVMQKLGGKLLIFQSTLPSLGIGRLRLRGNDPHVYGTDKEPLLRVPEDPFYKQMAADLTKYQIGANVYAFSDRYTDIASLGTIAKYTGCQIYYYPSFDGNIHGEKLKYELARDLTRETAWESVMRIRCGKGLRFSTYHGNFMLRSMDLLALPAVDCDKAFGAQLSMEDTLMTTQTVYFQVALLYTSSCGERRIRVHTAAAPVVTDLGEMYRQADTGAIVSLLSRLAIEQALSHKLEDARHFVQLKIVKAIKEYRNLYAVHHRLAGKMIYPESLKYLFLYGLSLYKSVSLRGGYADSQLDERCAAGYTMMTLSVRRLLKLLYPTLIRVDEYLVKEPANIDGAGKFLNKLPLSAESLDPRGLYIYDDGLCFIIWFGRELSVDIVNNLLGGDSSDLNVTSKLNLRKNDNEISRRLMQILERLRDSDPSCYQLCHVVRQGDQPRESSLLLGNLVEDKIGGTSGYVDWMLQNYRQVQQSA